MKSSQTDESKPFALYLDLSRFTYAVNYYLSYIELVAVPDSDKKADARPHFITESAVRFPLAEYLERRLNVSDLELEYKYLQLEPKRCDFKFTIKRAGGSNYDRCLAELKYVKSSISLQDYFDDIMRLHFAREYDEPGTKTFFIVCGKTSDFTHYFKNKKVVDNSGPLNNSDPFFTKQEKKDQNNEIIEETIEKEWLSFSGDEKSTMRISSSLWDNFKNSHFYKTDHKSGKAIPIVNPIPQMPVSIKTHKVNIAGGSKDSEHSVGIWEIF